MECHLYNCWVMREKKGDKEGTYVSDGGEVSSAMQIHVRTPPYLI